VITLSHFNYAAYLERIEALPPRMRAVTVRVCMGRSLESIADELGMALNTVRNHIKFCQERCRVSGGQKALVAFVLLGIRDDA
jgi:DNA-binding NarL/FixJ family response regulator